MKKIRIDHFHKIQCSDLEKTIVDCLFNPDYAGGIVEIAKAIYQSKDKIKYDTVLDYVVRFKSQAVLKRLGFLLETLNIQTDMIEKFHALRKASYMVLDTRCLLQAN